jgi:DNA-binding LacI/PurR family transcriptional regulator
MRSTDITKVAAAAEVSPFTVKRYLLGRPLHEGNLLKVERALKQLGLESHLMPARESDDTRSAGAR